MDEIKVYTPAEVAKILKVTPVTVYRNLTSGKLHGAKIGNLWRITDKDIEEFLKPVNK